MFKLETVKLIYPDAERNSSIKYYVRKENIFDVIHDVQLAIGNSGQNRIKGNTNKVQKHYSRKHHALLKFVHSLPQKIQSSIKSLVINPMIFTDINSRTQVDLIDMQSQPDSDLKSILVYQGHLTKFVELCPVKSKLTPEIAYQLLDILNQDFSF